MASLTDLLPTNNSGKSIVPTKVAQPSFVQGLSNFGQGAINAWENFDQANRRNRAEDRADRAEARAIIEDERQAGARAAINAANEESFNALDSYSRGQQVVEVPTVSVWSGPAEVAAQELAKSQLAVNQGRAPTGSFQLKLEKVQADLFQRFPEFKEEIAATLQRRGYDSYVFRDVQQQAAFDSAQQTAAASAQAMAIKKAADSGIPVDPNNPQAAAIAGYKLLANEYAVDIAKKQDQAVRDWKTDKYNDWKHANEISQVELSRAILRDFGDRFAGVNLSLANAIDAAGDDIQKQATIAEIAPRINTYYESARAQIMASVTDPEAQKGALAQLDEYKKSATALYTGDLAQYQTNKRNLDNLKTNWQLSEAQAYPVYNYFSSVFGKDTVASLFGGDISGTFPPEVASQIKQELQGYKTEGARAGSEHLLIISQLMNGNTNLKDMPEKKAREVLPQLVKTVNGVQAQVAAGQASPQDTKNWSNAYANVLIAGAELQPGQPKIDSILSASSVVASQGARGAMERIIKDPNQATNGQSLMLGSRGTSAQLLEAAKTSGPSTDANGVQSVQFSERSGKWFVLTDRKAYNDWASRQGRTGATNTGSFQTAFPDKPISFEQYAATSNPDLAKKVDALNLNTTHLVETAKYDPAAPKGTPLELANYYATGKSPVRTDSAGKPAKSANEQFNQSVEELSKGLREGVIANTESFKGASISPGDAVSRLVGRNVPRNIAAGIVGSLAQESGLNTGAVGDGGKALSLAQWHPDRQAYAKEHGYDLSDPNDAVDFVLHELNTTEGEAKKKLMSADTPEEAAEIFTRYFLRPNEKLANYEKRKSYARQFASGSN